MGTRGAAHDEERPQAVVAAAENALRLLRTFEDGREIRVSEASKTLGVSRSTVHRLLRTLGVHGFVEQDPASRGYRPGPVLTAIGLAAAQRSDARDAARSALVHLAGLTDETVHLAVLRGAQVVYLDSIESRQAVRTGSRIGWTLPSHVTAAGKALLAALSDREIKAVFPDEVIRGGAAGLRVRRDDLLAELELVRVRGYATNDGESEADIAAVGVVLPDRRGQARFALAVTSPRSRASEEWIRSAGQAAVQVAQQFRADVV